MLARDRHALHRSPRRPTTVRPCARSTGRPATTGRPTPAGCARMFAEFAAQRQPAGTAVRPPGRRASPPTTELAGAAAPRPADAAPAGAAARLRPRPPARPARRRRAGPLLPEPDRRTRTAAIRCRRSGAFCARPRRRARRAAGDPAARRPTRSAAARCCCRCSACSPPRSVPLAHLDVGASAGLNLLLDRYQLRATSPGGDGRRAVAGRARVRHPGRRAGPGGDAADRRSGVGLDRSPVDVHDADAAALAGGVRLAGPDRPLRAAAGRARASPPTRDSTSGRAMPSPTPPPLAAVARRPSGRSPTRGCSTTSAATSGAAYVGVARRARARERDLSWVFAESPVLVPELPVADRPESTRPRSSSCAGAAAGAPSTTSATPTPTATGCTGARSRSGTRDLEDERRRRSTRATGRRRSGRPRPRDGRGDRGPRRGEPARASQRRVGRRRRPRAATARRARRGRTTVASKSTSLTMTLSQSRADRARFDRPPRRAARPGSARRPQGAACGRRRARSVGSTAWQRKRSVRSSTAT